MNIVHHQHQFTMHMIILEWLQTIQINVYKHLLLQGKFWAIQCVAWSRHGDMEYYTGRYTVFQTLCLPCLGSEEYVASLMGLESVSNTRDSTIPDIHPQNGPVCPPRGKLSMEMTFSKAVVCLGIAIGGVWLWADIRRHCKVLNSVSYPVTSSWNWFLEPVIWTDVIYTLSSVTGSSHVKCENNYITLD